MPSRRTILKRLVAGILIALLAFHFQFIGRHLCSDYHNLNFLFRHAVNLYPLSQEVEWHDDMPYRNQTPWDISTDFPYPRILKFQVNEGTWLRLDVHTKSGDIVFDMLGDIYCIPAAEAYTFQPDAIARARPVLLGVPYDAEPRFSPEGDKLAFRSDAGLGLDNLWVMPWRGCQKMDLRPSTGESTQKLARALAVKAAEDLLLAQGVRETLERRVNRLVREGRFQAQRITNETWRTVTAPRFHPSGTMVVGTKWYQGYVTLGAPEGWEYPIPDLGIEQPPGSVETGSGTRIFGRTLPPGKTSDDYPNLQVGPEQFIFSGEDCIIYAKNVIEDFTMSSEKDPYRGIFALFQRNLTTGREETLVDAVPGSAMRPELSRDGRTLAFVRRLGDHDVLVTKDLESGNIRYLWHGLSIDFSTIWSASSGPYPSFAFTPSDEAIVIWARGQIYYVPLARNEHGEKVAGGTPQPISFSARIEQQVAETSSASIDLLGLETRDTQRVHAFTDLRVDEKGERAVFQAAGIATVQVIGESNVTSVPVLRRGTPYYSPSFIPGANHLVLHARWSDTQFTAFELANLDTGDALELTGVPLGRYFSPVLSPPLMSKSGPTRRIAFVKTGGDIITGHVVATSKPGVYIGIVTLPDESNFDSSTQIHVSDIRLVSSNVNTVEYREIVLEFISDSLLLVRDTYHAFTLDLSVNPNEVGEYDPKVLASAKVGNEIAPTFGAGKNYVVFVEYSHVYLAPSDDLKMDEIMGLSAKPRSSTKGLARLSDHGGHSIALSGDYKKLFWFLGPFIYSLDLSKLNRCASEIRQDRDTFGISCIDKLVERHEIFVHHLTDVARLKGDIDSQNTNDDGVVVVVNATLLTMASGNESEDLIPNGILVLKSGLILDVGHASKVRVPENATVIDAERAFVIPGFFDSHAHWGSVYTRYPAKTWELQIFLAYGVTSVHNPSSGTVTGFIERSRVENGQLLGPRIFMAGNPIFAGTWLRLHEEIVDEQQAYSALYRIKAEGGPFSHSYKNYNLPSRASRQRLLKASRKLNMLCVPEGAGFYDWDLTYIIDGMATHEHNLPFPILYEDVMKLFSLSGTGYTPTYIVYYGGPPGENYLWANHDVPNDPKLRRFIPHDTLQTLTEATAAPRYAYTLFNASMSTAKMSRMGLPIHIGAHGEDPKGLAYHAEMFFAKEGGLSNYEVLNAAISNGPKTFGLSSSIGSLSPGKFADFLIYRPGVDLLYGPINNTLQLRYVARGGKIWDASTMAEFWPVKGRTQDMPPFNAE